MASNLSKRLDKLEKGILQFIESQNPTGPIYISEGVDPRGETQSV